MKKKALAIILIGISIGLIGCSNAATQKKNVASDKNSTEQVSEDTTSQISLDDAKEIALKDANLTSDKVTFIKTKLYSLTEVKKYDIDFSYDNKEYDYEIGATDGKIITSKVENMTTSTEQSQESQQQTPVADQSQQSQSQQQTQVADQSKQQTQTSQKSTNEISIDEAKSIALKHANLTSDKVSFLKAELDTDNGVRKYEIDFNYNNKEYDYEIDASTGSIISYEIDK